jgi:hypothetical protein
MAIWPFDAIMAIRPYSHMAILASNVGNMGVFGNGNTNFAGNEYFAQALCILLESALHKQIILEGKIQCSN